MTSTPDGEPARERRPRLPGAAVRSRDGAQAADDEAALVRRARAGDDRAFEALVQRHVTYAFNLALRTLRSPEDAEDVVQEAFVRAWRALPGFRQEARFGTWLYRIVTNLCYDRLPSLRRELAAGDVDDLPTPHIAVAGGIGDAAATSQRRAWVRGALDALPPGYRLLLTLRHYHELPYQEIAEVTGMPLGTVKTGLHRGRKALGEALRRLDAETAPAARDNGDGEPGRQEHDP